MCVGGDGVSTIGCMCNVYSMSHNTSTGTNMLKLACSYQYLYCGDKIQ